MSSTTLLLSLSPPAVFVLLALKLVISLTLILSLLILIVGASTSECAITSQEIVSAPPNMQGPIAGTLSKNSIPSLLKLRVRSTHFSKHFPILQNSPKF